MKIQSVVLESNEASLKIAACDNVSPPKAIVNNKHARPLMLGQLDEMVQRFLQATYKAGFVNSAMAIATAKALTERYPNLELSDIVRQTSALSLFSQMNFVRRQATTGEVHSSKPHSHTYSYTHTHTHTHTRTHTHTHTHTRRR